ncbi:prostacyclin synthase [Colletotrichum karsti]|uniref:Prostacyclin synthase n=1 Tax=Colletotrichum karsti TaxID=1095194 RepID=A0A9P6HY04_9PEZI|nr:prostacyclin synthase [Colletotrichum karsti]KAF9871136.1 prostacyclin synthase [Colletotrichum karsti]
MYVVNTASLVQSCMRNKNLDFGARIEEIAAAMGVDTTITRRLVRENAVEEISRVTISALSGDNLLRLNLMALEYIGSRFNEVKAGTPIEIDDFYHWTRDLIGTATTRALYGEHSPFNDPKLVDCIWKYETGLGKLQYGWLTKLIAGKALDARRTMVTALASYYVRKLDQGDTVSAVIRGRAAFWRSFGLSDATIGAMDSLPAASTVNTAPSMFWLLVNVFSNPKYLTRLREEVEGATAITITKDGDRRVANVDVTALGNSCPYLVACYRETLRFENTVTGSRMVMSKDTTITDHETGREYLLKEGVEVQWSASVMHKKPVWGDDREVFNPERWLKSTPDLTKGSKESFVPFGGGKHLCPGRNFAFAELLGCLAVLAVGYEVEGVQVPAHAMLFEHSGLRSPIYGNKSKKAVLRRRQSWEDENPTMKVAIVGATGETGSSIVNGLLASSEPKFELTALIRPSSLQKPEVQALEKRGVKIAGVDLGGSEDEIVKQVTGFDVVISAIVADALLDQLPLANASKKAGVKRFVPCFFGTVMPARGMLWFRDQKEDVLNHVQTLYLPYTVIDVGWWYQITLPRLPSGRIDAVATPFDNWIAGDGTAKSAFTDLRDIGKYVARIIADPGTLNQRVFAYTELLTQNEIYELLERVSGEKIERKHLSGEDIEAAIKEAKNDVANPHKLSILQYRKSWGLRGDNSPDYAKYLGYQIGKELYPDLTGKSLEDFCKEALDGKIEPIFQKKRREAIEAAQKQADGGKA